MESICEYIMSLDTKEVTGVIGLILQAFTLLFAFKIYKNFDIKKEYHRQQYEKVLELVTEINSHNLYLVLRTPAQTPESALAEMKELLPEGYPDSAVATINFAIDFSQTSFFGISCIALNERFENSIVCSDSEITKTFSFLEYRNDPLIPKVIADTLYSSFPLYSRRTDVKNETNILLSLGNTSYQDAFCFQMGKPVATWSEYMAISKRLREVISKWLAEFGAEEINFNLEQKL